MKREKKNYNSNQFHLVVYFFLPSSGSRRRDSIPALPAPASGRRLQHWQVRLSALAWHALSVNRRLFGEKTFGQSVCFSPHPCPPPSALRPYALRLSLQKLLSGYNHEAKALLKSEVSLIAAFKNISDAAGGWCFHSFCSSLLPLQSTASVAAVTDSVCGVRNLLCGLSPQQLDDAIGALNRVGPLALVGRH